VPGGPGRPFIGTLIAVLALLAAACSGGDDSTDNGTDGAAASTSPDTNETTSVANDLRLDQIQAIGTHNSFHVEADPAELALLDQLAPGASAERRYTHRPLAEQLDDQRVRQLELDVYLDSDGGRYADPVLRRQAGLGPYDPAMAEPGIKVLHEQDVDYHSRCLSLVACLTEVKEWSDDHRQHVPIAIHIQLKDGALIFPVPDQAVPERWEPAQMDELDAEIASVFPGDRIITPDDVRGDEATLDEAVRAHRWPTLGESRGKVLFLMINADEYRTAYLTGHDALRGRILFTNAPPGEPDAAYVGIDDPIANQERISDLVAQGYLVRTRSDDPKVQVQAGDTARLEAALASGAQWVSTDYPGPDGARPRLGTDYLAELPGDLVARCNPVTAPADCEDATVEP
jgi:hypothetical protein